MDIFSLIMEDHKKVAQLFKQLRETKGSLESREQLFAQLKEDLEVHRHTEEQVFYPALQENDVTHDMALDALDDHRLVAELLEELAISPKQGEEWDEKLLTLEEHVEEHVEEEEDEIFETARQLFSAGQGRELGERWQTAKQEYMASRISK
jgi:hemerythrin-like domain-containing protein